MERKLGAATGVMPLGLVGATGTTGEGVFVPAGTSPAIVARLNAEIGKVLADPSIRERYAQAALDAVGGTPEDFAKVVKADFVKWAKVVKDSGARVD